MGKADLKVTVGLLVLGVALGAILLRVMNPPPNQHQPATSQQGIVRLKAPPATVPGASVVPGSPATPSPASQEPARTSQTNRIAATQEVLPQGLQGFHSWSGKVVDRDAISLTIEFAIPDAAESATYRTETHTVTWSNETTFKRVMPSSAQDKATEGTIQPSDVAAGDQVVIGMDANEQSGQELLARAIVVVVPPVDEQQRMSGPIYGKLTAVRGNTLTVLVSTPSPDTMKDSDLRKIGPLLVTPGDWSVTLTGEVQISRVVMPNLKPFRVPADPNKPIKPIIPTQAQMQDLRVGDNLVIYFSSKDDALRRLEASRVDVLEMHEG